MSASTCQHCGKPLEQKTKGPAARYCDARCRKAAQRARRVRSDEERAQARQRQLDALAGKRSASTASSIARDLQNRGLMGERHSEIKEPARELFSGEQVDFAWVKEVLDTERDMPSRGSSWRWAIRALLSGRLYIDGFWVRGPHTEKEYLALTQESLHALSASGELPHSMRYARPTGTNWHVAGVPVATTPHDEALAAIRALRSAEESRGGI